MRLVDSLSRGTYVEIDTKAIASNVRQITRSYPGYDFYIGVVKGNAYGHGMEIIPTLIKNGINYLAVSNLEEALEVREIDPHIPILCLEPIDLNFLDICLDKQITLTISSYDYYKKLLLKNPGGLKVHLKLNTGLNRLGISDKQIFKKMFCDIVNSKNIELEGIYTHLATTGVTDALYDRQIARFNELTAAVDLSKVKIVHIGRSSTLEFHTKIPIANAVRIGLAMYGIAQTPRSYGGLKGLVRKIRDNIAIKRNHISKTLPAGKLPLKTGFALKSTVMEINPVNAGERIGYGGAYVVNKTTLVAICPVGYADGLNLNYKNCQVSINSQRYPIIGTVDMCMIAIKVDNKVKVGDIATLIGDDIPAKEVACRTGNTVYAVMTQIARNLKRVYR